MNNSSGIFQVDELLKKKLVNSSIAPFVEVLAHLEGEGDSDRERRLVEVYRL
jgi:metal-dependent HD superfamily phosphatase/phosphodiesterase